MKKISEAAIKNDNPSSNNTPCIPSNLYKKIAIIGIVTLITVLVVSSNELSYDILSFFTISFVKALYDGPEKALIKAKMTFVMTIA
ncbi:Uncharacterised protein [Streptococcus pneumoniae]|nr:Uncharacterised protein [Streptococcus pneumoniae]SNJ48640.1 Uncharacterised protein [Streptococcus pneumoniae]VIZ42747.1 Uncharacterised protein [Streptococcus pneumoniae]VJT07711.1 Uncharacterised protein [Streptococcus pneumoniae]VKI54346.1 Uncharacterised protein [Streptococcus pneumoniae]